jgi:glycyl-tRNA synthetase beta chain
LRRAAQGIVKILFEARLAVHIDELVAGLPQLREFMLERVQFYLREIQGFAYDEVNAVLAAPATTLSDIADRTDAVHYVRPTADFEPLAASFKRIKNILRQAGVTSADSPNPALLTAGPEGRLYTQWHKVRSQVEASASYRDKLSAIASLRPHVDLFFDKVLVNDPDPKIRQNRLALLSGLLAEFSTIADFSEIVTQGA